MAATFQGRDTRPFSGSEWGTPYNGLYGKAPTGRDTLFRLEVYKRADTSRVKD